MSDSPTDIPQDKQLINLFVQHFLKLLQKADAEIPSATLEVIRKLLQDNAVTLASVRRGDFGIVAQQAEEAFPFNPDGSHKGEVIMLGRKNN